MMSDFIWDDLKYFMAVTAEESVANAARGLKVEHSTVVRRITRLESTLNVRLFNRFARGWILTEEGRTLKVEATAVEAQMMSIQRFSLSLDDISGPVTITAPPDLMSDLVSPQLLEFQEKHTGIELTLIGELKTARLSRGEADIALRMSKVEGAELVTQRICDVTYGFYGNRETLDKNPEDRKFIGYSEAHQPYINETLLHQAAGRPIVLRTNNLKVARQAALRGVGVALLPNFLAEKSSDLLVVEKPVTIATYPIYLVMQRDMRNAKRVRILAEYIKRKLPEALRK